MIVWPVAFALTASPAPRCVVVEGLDAAGIPTAEWIEAIRDRVDPPVLTAIAADGKPFTSDQAAWLAAVRAALPSWCAEVARLNAPFRWVAPPSSVEILLGNQGGGDGFTGGPDTVAFDLAEIVGEMGPPQGKESAAFVRLLLSHEYTHLLLHRMLDRLGWSEQWSAQEPFRRALRVLYNEGIANMRSIENDPRWITPGGEITPFARGVLAELEPLMIERLQGLAARPSEERATELLRNISQGPLARKWGAIPIALWLWQDTAGDPDKLARWIERGPSCILDLALRRADPGRRRTFRALTVRAHAERPDRGQGADSSRR